MPCAEGTVCAPAGLTHELQILHPDQSEDASPATALPTMYEMPLVGSATFTRVHGGLVVVGFLLHCGIITALDQ